MFMVTERLKDISYAIRDIAIIADEVMKTGKEIYNLNIGDPVKYDFSTPHYISQALAEATFSGQNFYVDSLGVPELRYEVCKYEQNKNSINITPNDILITSGVTEGLFFLFAALLEKKNEILVPGPSYPIYITYSKFFDGVPVEYELNELNNWEPDIDDLRKKISDKTKAILINSPNNPTGVLYNSKNIKQIIELAGEYTIPIISDEIYDQIVFEKKYSCPATFTNDIPIIGLNGFSKAHLATGWRLGYVYYYDRNKQLVELKQSIEKMARARLCANSIAQYAAIEALKNPGSHTDEMVKKLKERRDYSYKRLVEIEGISCNRPDGAFYLFPKLDFNILNKWKNDKDFVINLLKETGICTVYGSGFGNYGINHLRMTFLPNLEKLEIIYDLLVKFVK
ncbi:MAG: aminotransferase class I/II-fold pyridoxal phosphate-dependent enzyme [Candidatus Lokiarchaeota archaeon]|nr:aminotransferase class I/II-fold pyridoxal phosphate-dependent enzyme [Candidatus Lokiarchaeota archaeon]